MVRNREGDTLGKIDVQHKLILIHEGLQGKKEILERIEPKFQRIEF